MAEEIVTSPEESVSMEAPIVEAPVDIQEDVVDVEPTPTANAKGIENFKKLHKILAADEVYSQITPADFNQFLSKYSDITKLQKLHKIIAADEVYSQIMPSDLNEAADKYGFGGLGKPSAVPSASVGGGSATKGRGVEQPSPLQPRKSSEVEQSVMGYALPKTIDIGGGKAKAEEELRLPTDAEFATIEKMPLTKEAKLEEAVRLGTPPAEKATKDIKSNKDKILSSEEELNKLEKELATYKQQSDSLLAAYNNEQLSPEERNKAGQEYNKVNEIAKPIEDRRNELYGSYQGYINNQKVLFNELDKAEKMRQKGLEKEYSYVQNLFESTASYSVKALTGIVKMESMIGNLIMSPISSRTEEMLRKRKLDVSLKLVNKFADELITQEVPENYKKLFEGEFSPGKLGYITTNAIASTIPTIAAGFLTGGAGSVMVGAGMGYEESRNIMKDAGLTDEQADWAAFALAIPIGFLEKYGADDLINLFSRSGLRKEVATELAKKVAGKTLTKEAIYLETKKTFGELIKAKTAKLITSGGKESITEMTQGELVEGVKQFVEEVTGVDKDENMSTQDYVMQQLKQRGEEGAGGFLGGTSMQGFGTAYSAIANKQEFSPSAYTKAMEFADPAKFQQFQNDLMLEVQNGVLTEEQANEAVANVQAIQETNALIPNSVQNLDLRTEAVNLIIEKNNIAKEIEGKDPDLIAPENARLAEIKKALNEIAIGKKPGAEEQQVEGEKRVKTLADDIEVGDTVDLTPKSIALKADIEERRAAELEPINLAIAESERTGEVPVVNGEPVNKKTIDDINAKYDTEQAAVSEAPQTLPEVENAITNLREQEKAENEETYDKYDEVITPLLEQEKELKAEEAQAPVVEEAKGTSIIDIKLDSDAKIESRMAEIEGDKSKQGEFNEMEKEMERRERSSVFDVPLQDVKGAIDVLLQKEKDKPNGFGAFIEKRDARETKEVANRYSNAKEITDKELKRDFTDAVLGNPDTWYADGLKLRESINEATRRGINLQEMIADVEQKFINDGFTLEDAKATIQRRLSPVFNGAEVVQENESKLIEAQAPVAEEAKVEATAKEAESSNASTGWIKIPPLLARAIERISSKNKKKESNNNAQLNEEQTIINPSVIAENINKLGSKEKTTKEEESAVIERYAKENKIWISDLDLVYEKEYSSGAEAKVYLSDGGKTVTKVIKNASHHKSWNSFLNRIAVYNSIFPETKYEVIGFGNKNGNLSIVLKQPFVSYKRGASIEEVDNDMKNRGFEKLGKGAFINRDTGVYIRDLYYEMFDMKKTNRNVIISKNGEIRYIDPVIKIGNEEESIVEKSLAPKSPESQTTQTAQTAQTTQTASAPTSEQAPQAFPAQEGATAEQEQQFKANPELEQIYRELQAAVNKNIDEQTLRILKANPSEAMIKKAFDILQRKGVIKIDCN